jgi:hypothetical protein
MPSLERRTPQGHCVRPFEDWGKLIGDVPSATAILDRFLHHAEIISITGKSYRLRNKTEPAADVEQHAPKPATMHAGKTRRKSSAPSSAAVTAEESPTADACQS